MTHPGLCDMLCDMLAPGKRIPAYGIRIVVLLAWLVMTLGVVGALSLGSGGSP